MNFLAERSNVKEEGFAHWLETVVHGDLGCEWGGMAAEIGYEACHTSVGQEADSWDWKLTML